MEFLRLWHPIRDYVEIKQADKGELSVTVRGPLFSAMQFEIYLLEIINEVYFRMAFAADTPYQRLSLCSLISLRYQFFFIESGCISRPLPKIIFSEIVICSPFFIVSPRIENVC